jgi:hypothetical protein
MNFAPFSGRRDPRRTKFFQCVFKSPLHGGKRHLATVSRPGKQRAAPLGSRAEAPSAPPEGLRGRLPGRGEPGTWAAAVAGGSGAALGRTLARTATSRAGFAGSREAASRSRGRAPVQKGRGMAWVARK